MSIFHPDLEAPTSGEDLRVDDIIAVVTYLDGQFNTWSQYKIYSTDNPDAYDHLFKPIPKGHGEREVRWLVKAPRTTLEPDVWGVATHADGRVARGFVDHNGLFYGHTPVTHFSVAWTADQIQKWEPLELVHQVRAETEKDEPLKTEDLYPAQDPEPPHDWLLIDADGDRWEWDEQRTLWSHGFSVAYSGAWVRGGTLSDYAPFRKDDVQ